MPGLSGNFVPLKEGAFKELSAGKGFLVGNRCSRCGLICFPKTMACPGCMELLDDNEVMFGQRGQIDAFTICYVAPEGFNAPYIQAYVKTKEGPKIFSLIEVDADGAKSLRKGQEMELKIKIIGKDTDGRMIIGWMYKPVEGEG